MQKTTETTRGRERRRGAVAVEFAFVAPVLLTIVLGIIEVSRLYESQNMLQTAAREGARLAGMDRSNMLQPGQSTNDKIASDLQSQLGSLGIPADKVNVSITDHESPGQDFDLDDPSNDLKLFDLTIEVPYSEMSVVPIPEANDFGLSATITFRNGRAVLAN